jgi:hypothetical protein
MARVKSAVAGEDILAEEEAASTPFAAADKPRKTLSARATWTARETFRRQEANNLPTCIPLEAVALLLEDKIQGMINKCTRSWIYKHMFIYDDHLMYFQKILIIRETT